MITVKLALQFSPLSKIGQIHDRRRTEICGTVFRRAARLYDACDTEADYDSLRDRLRDGSAIGNWSNTLSRHVSTKIGLMIVAALISLGLFTMFGGYGDEILSRLDRIILTTTCLLGAICAIFGAGLSYIGLAADRADFQLMSKMFRTRVDRAASVGWTGNLGVELCKASLFMPIDVVRTEDGLVQTNTADLVLRRILSDTPQEANMIQFVLAVTLLQRNMVDNKGKILPFYRQHILNKNDLAD